MGTDIFCLLHITVMSQESHDISDHLQFDCLSRAWSGWHQENINLCFIDHLCGKSTGDGWTQRAISGTNCAHVIWSSYVNTQSPFVSLFYLSFATYCLFCMTPVLVSVLWCVWWEYQRNDTCFCRMPQELVKDMQQLWLFVYFQPSTTSNDMWKLTGKLQFGMAVELIAFWLEKARATYVGYGSTKYSMVPL